MDKHFGKSKRAIPIQSVGYGVAYHTYLMKLVWNVLSSWMIYVSTRTAISQLSAPMVGQRSTQIIRNSKSSRCHFYLSFKCIVFGEASEICFPRAKVCCGITRAHPAFPGAGRGRVPALLWAPTPYLQKGEGP